MSSAGPSITMTRPARSTTKMRPVPSPAWVRKIGLVKLAEKVPKKDRLLRLEVDLGEEAPRQIVAGIAEHFASEALVGRRVVVVANLAPRKLAGLESQGMVLAANTPDGGLDLITVGDAVAPGTAAK